MGLFDDWNNSQFGQNVNAGMRGLGQSVRSALTPSTPQRRFTGTEFDLSDADRHQMMENDITKSMQTRAQAAQTMSGLPAPNGLQEPAATTPTATPYNPAYDVDRMRQEQWKAQAPAAPAAPAAPLAMPAAPAAPVGQQVNSFGMRSMPNFGDDSAAGLQKRLAYMQNGNQGPAVQNPVAPRPVQAPTSAGSEYGQGYTDLKSSLRRP